MSVKVFYCYSHEDKTLRLELEKHLANLMRQKLITGWSDRNIDAGRDWASEIDLHLHTANIILLLISPDFMNSEYCYSKEMALALERHENRTAIVIPIILRPVEFDGAPFSHLQALPTGAVPVRDRKWRSRDEAFRDVAQGIRKVVLEILSQQLVEEGNSCYYREQYEEALQFFERAIHYCPNNVAAYIGQGQTFNRLAPLLVSDDNLDTLDSCSKTYEKAEKAFIRAIELDPDNAAAHAGKGEALLEIHIDFLGRSVKSEEILDAFEQAIRLDPNDENAYFGKGNALLIFNRYKEAIAAYNKSIEIAGFSSRDVSKKLGFALFRSGQYQEAFAVYETLIKEFPLNEKLYVDMASILYQLERYPEALLAYEKAISLGAIDSETYTAVGTTYIKLGKKHKALEAFDKALNMMPEYLRSTRAKVYREREEVYLSLAQADNEMAERLEPQPDPFLPDYPDDLS